MFSAVAIALGCQTFQIWSFSVTDSLSPGVLFSLNFQVDSVVPLVNFFSDIYFKKFFLFFFQFFFLFFFKFFLNFNVLLFLEMFLIIFHFVLDMIK